MEKGPGATFPALAKAVDRPELARRETPRDRGEGLTRRLAGPSVTGTLVKRVLRSSGPFRRTRGPSPKNFCVCRAIYEPLRVVDRKDNKSSRGLKCPRSTLHLCRTFQRTCEVHAPSFSSFFQMPRGDQRNKQDVYKLACTVGVGTYTSLTVAPPSKCSTLLKKDPKALRFRNDYFYLVYESL